MSHTRRQLGRKGFRSLVSENELRAVMAAVRQSDAWMAFAEEYDIWGGPTLGEILAERSEADRRFEEANPLIDEREDFDRFDRSINEESLWGGPIDDRYRDDGDDGCDGWEYDEEGNLIIPPPPPTQEEFEAALGELTLRQILSEAGCDVDFNKEPPTTIATTCYCGLGPRGCTHHGEARRIVPERPSPLMAY